MPRLPRRKRNNTMDDNALARSIQASAEKVFKSMFAMDVEHDGFARKSELQGGDEILSIIGIRGDCKGSFMLVCDPPSACHLVSTMLGVEVKAEDSEVLDGVGELANIVMGNLKDVLEEGGKDVGITPPTVIHGDNMIVRSRAKQEWLVVPFSTYNARFEVRIVLKD